MVGHAFDRETALLLYKTLILPIYDYCYYMHYHIGADSKDIYYIHDYGVVI